jgi:uncharacterized protein YjbI with pentapeptide repeats
MLGTKLAHLSNRAVMGILVGIALLSSLLSAGISMAAHGSNPSDWWISWLQNFSTEMFGAFLTFVLIELVVGGRQRQEADFEKRQQDQISAMSRLRQADTAEARKPILAEMKKLNLLYGIDLYRADLQDAPLANANLYEATLSGANLEGANLGRANLYNASLRDANLRRTRLDYAILREAALWRADLRGSNLREADLQGAKLGGAQFDENTVLPDSKKWTPDANLARFTDPKRSDFWRSGNPTSPAYGQDDEEV